MVSMFGKKPFWWIALTIVVLAAAGVLCLVNSNHREANNGQPSAEVDNNAAIWEFNAADTDIKGMIEPLLSEIMKKGPKASSNPYDYVKDSGAFQKIVQLGQPALDYMLESLGKSDVDGLREYIMACACAKIMGIYDEEAGIGTNSGREWFYKYGKSQSMDNFRQVDADYFRYKVKNDERFERLYERYFANDVDKSNMEDVVSDYMLEVNRDAYLIGEKAVEAYKILGYEEKSGTTYLYLQAVFRWFGFENGIFTSISGGGDVVRMQLTKSGTGEYEVTEYKRAMGGRMWKKSIRDMFPRDLAEKVIRDNAAIGEELWNMQVDKARTYLKEIGREDAPIEPVVKKNKESEGASRAIYQVTSTRNGFPDWVGTREMILNAGGGSLQMCS